MTLRSDQVGRLSAKFPGLIVNETCSVIDSSFGHNVVLADGTDIYMSSLGARTYVAGRTSIAWADIGKFCSIGPNSFVGMAAHPSRRFVSTHPIFYLAMPERNLEWADQNYFDGATRTRIGHDVWIGGNVSIKSGVSIGHGAIIGAGAVVTRDVPPYAIMAGVPARKIRDRFTPQQIVRLLEIQWWEMNEELLSKQFRDFHEIKRFLEKFDANAPSVPERPSK